MNSRFGWSLIEVILASALLMSLVPPLFEGGGNVWRSVGEAREKQIALFFMENLLEETLQEPYDDVQDDIQGEGEIHVVEVEPGIKQVEILYRWQKGREPLALVSLVRKE